MIIYVKTLGKLQRFKVKVSLSYENDKASLIVHVQVSEKFLGNYGLH